MFEITCDFVFVLFGGLQACNPRHSALLLSSLSSFSESESWVDKILKEHRIFATCMLDKIDIALRVVVPSRIAVVFCLCVRYGYLQHRK